MFQSVKTPETKLGTFISSVLLKSRVNKDFDTRLTRETGLMILRNLDFVVKVNILDVLVKLG